MQIWDDDLEKIAQRWSQQCPENNKSDNCRSYCEYYITGNTIFLFKF